MYKAGILDKAHLHVIAETHQWCLHHGLDEVAAVSCDGPVLLGGQPLLELLPLQFQASKLLLGNVLASF